MDFPRYVFTSKSEEEECELGSYGTVIVEDKEEFDAAIKAGYKKVLTDLFEKPKPKIEAIKKPKTKTFKEIEVEKKSEPDKDDF
jgi:hypothetical protein